MVYYNTIKSQTYLLKSLPYILMKKLFRSKKRKTHKHIY